MRTHTIALIASGETATSHSGWWEPIIKSWPALAAAPRVELLTLDDLLASTKPHKATWDAVVIAPVKPTLGTPVCRVLDILQQFMTPAVVLVENPGGLMNAPHALAREKLEGFHPGSVIALPLDAPGSELASIIYGLTERQAAVRVLDQNLRLAQSFHGETAAEIDRLQQELLLAAKVQRDFLPKHMPLSETVRSGVLFRPASFVSGDTYDVTQLDEHHISFFLADAMGHGVPAALMTLFVTGSLPRSEIVDGHVRIVPPGEALERLNCELHDCFAGPTRFVTAVCGVIDTRSGLITMACAGHPPPLRISRHGTKPVDVSGMLLGVLPDSKYPQVTFRLEEGELLVLYSDGIEAAFSTKAPASEGPSSPVPPHFLHMACMRRGEASSSIDAAIERLAAEIDSQAGSFHQDDDLTVLAFETACVVDPLAGMPVRTDGGSVTSSCHPVLRGDPIR